MIGNAFKRFLIYLIRCYRGLRPDRAPCCRYTPSCSEYAIQALEKHGAAKGSLLACWRVLRCNPFSKGGYDPVPEKGRWNNKKRGVSSGGAGSAERPSSVGSAESFPPCAEGEQQL